MGSGLVAFSLSSLIAGVLHSTIGHEGVLSEIVARRVYGRASLSKVSLVDSTAGIAGDRLLSLLSPTGRMGRAKRRRSSA